MVPTSVPKFNMCAIIQFLALENVPGYEIHCHLCAVYKNQNIVMKRTVHLILRTVCHQSSSERMCIIAIVSLFTLSRGLLLHVFSSVLIRTSLKLFTEQLTVDFIKVRPHLHANTNEAGQEGICKHMP